MASTNRTDNYNLPQFIGSDKPTWLGDVNGAMLTIDTAMKANADNVASVRTDTDNNSASIIQTNTNVSNLEDEVDVNTSNIASLQNSVTTNTSNISTNTNNIASIDGRLGNSNISEIGDGTITGAIYDIEDTLGTFFNAEGNEITLASSTMRNAVSLTLQPGTYIIEGTCTFASASGGYRWMKIATSPTAESGSQIDTLSQSGASPSFRAFMSKTLFVRITTPTTYYVNLYQTSGSSIVASARLNAIKLK